MSERENRFKSYDPLSCLNCGEQFEREVVFCPTCGQKNRKSELSLVKWLQEGLSTFFHLEGKSWNTVKDLPVPGRLVNNYLNGKRQRYVHPFRLLVFSSLICLGILSLLSESDKSYNFVNLDQKITIDTSDLAKGTTPDSLSSMIIRSPKLHPIGSRMKAVDILRYQIVEHDRFRLLVDSIQASGFATANESCLLDSLRRFYAMPTSWAGKGFASIAGDTLDFDPRTVAFGTPKQVVDNEEFKSWPTRLIAKKAVQLYQQGTESLGQYLNNSISWAILIFVPFLALGYKLFYYKKLPFYTQHLTYSAVLMSVILLLFTLGSVLSACFGGNPIPILLALLLFWIYNLQSDRIVFQVSVGHALFKLLIFSIYGFTSFVVSFIIWILIVVLMA